MSISNFLLYHILFDIVIFISLFRLIKRPVFKYLFSVVFIALSAYAYYQFNELQQIRESRSFFSGTAANYPIAVVITSLITKLFWAALILIQDLGRFIVGIKNVIFKQKTEEEKIFPPRRKFLTLAAAGLAGIPFLGMIYSMTKGKYAYVVDRVKLQFSDLPKSFHGLTIVQISDIHAGSYEGTEGVLKGVEMINELKPDVILFTGDLINHDKDEIDPFVPIFSKLQSKYGVYAVLGNHDYYGFRRMEEGVAKEQYKVDFYDKFKQLGFTLLNNDHRFIEIEGERICITGVENWGRGRWWPKEGDLEKALPTEELFTILLSHDPTHWEDKVLTHPRHIPLTLSGHTHGFQFGVNFKNLKWSPAQYRYKRWMGLYEEKDQYLYINRGFGFLAMPGRVGMMPEITLFTLESA